MKKTNKMIFLSMMLSFSLVLYYIESTIPTLNFVAPGAKLGLSNIISLTCMYIFGLKEALIILTMKVLISSAFYGGLSTFMYSISGGLLSLIAMFIMKKINLRYVSIIGISVVGSLFFNIGQLIVASLVLNNIKIFYYLPYMALVSIGTGIFVGISSKFLIEHLEKVMKK